MADVGAGGEDPVVTFEGIEVLTPRGCCSVELHLSFLRIQGEDNDLEIQYSSIARLFLLPKSMQPHIFFIVSLDPPVQKGQTLYPHIVMQFETDLVVQKQLAIKADIYYTKYKDKLKFSYKGVIHEVFTTILCGLTGAKVTKPGQFRSFLDAYAVKSSLKAVDGVLYPLKKSFFFVPKSPTFILHEEIDYVGFERCQRRIAGGVAGGSIMQYFNLFIRLKSKQQHIFRYIQRNEYCNLYSFICSKRLKIMVFGYAQPHVCMAQVLEKDDVDDDDALDPHLERIKNEAGGDESDEDEDFVVDKDDGGSPTDESGGEDSDASDSGDEEENLKKTKPGILFTDMGSVLGEKWKKMSAEDKEPYEAKGRADKKLYIDEISGYKNPQSMNVDSGNESKVPKILI